MPSASHQSTLHSVSNRTAVSGGGWSPASRAAAAAPPPATRSPTQDRAAGSHAAARGGRRRTAVTACQQNKVVPEGDLDRGCRNNDLVALHTHAVSGSMTKPASALHPLPQSRLRGRDGHPEPVAVGTIIWLASELMFFAALFAAYFTIRNVTNAQAAPGRRDPVAEPGRADQHPVRHRQHHGPGGQLVHLPDGRVRGRARPGQAVRWPGQHPAVGSARVVRADLPDGRVLHRRSDL